jgi:hypothetical protein
MKKCRACKISESQMTFLLFSKNTFTFYQALEDKSLLCQQPKAFKKTPTHTCRASKISESQITFLLFSKNTFTFLSSLKRQKSP